jgi:glucan 1,3-beta-glucosidase
MSKILAQRVMARQTIPRPFKRRLMVCIYPIIQLTLSQLTFSAGGRCLWGCGPGDPPAKTLKPALIYFPSGTYKISRTINSYIFTQLVGNPLDRPVLKADKNFSGLYLLDTFPSPTTSPFPTTINLYYQVRNFVFDTTSVDVKSTVACVNWPSAQAVTLSFNHLKMAENSLHQGVVFNGTTGGGGGSATFMGDLEFTGGNIGVSWQCSLFNRYNLNTY